MFRNPCPHTLAALGVQWNRKTHVNIAVFCVFCLTLLSGMPLICMGCNLGCNGIGCWFRVVMMGAVRDVAMAEDIGDILDGGPGRYKVTATFESVETATFLCASAFKATANRSEAAEEMENYAVGTRHPVVFGNGDGNNPSACAVGKEYDSLNSMWWYGAAFIVSAVAIFVYLCGENRGEIVEQCRMLSTRFCPRKLSAEETIAESEETGEDGGDV